MYVMLVFGVKYRLGLIDNSWKKRLYAVIVQIAREQKCIVLAIGGMRDHVHILLSITGSAPDMATITREIKAKSSKWVNENKLCVGRFGWQNGCGRFSYSYRELEMIKNYINNQERHHCNMDYCAEFKRLVAAAGYVCRAECAPDELV
jgi:REP element-mobilizing transposase RayT